MTSLERATQTLESQLDVLKGVREPYKTWLAYKKHLENKLIRDAVGKSHAEKCVNAYASIEWGKFCRKLSELENAYDHEELKFDVLKHNYQTQYLMAKESEEQIKRYR